MPATYVRFSKITFHRFLAFQLEALEIRHASRACANGVTPFQLRLALRARPQKEGPIKLTRKTIVNGITVYSFLTGVHDRTVSVSVTKTKKRKGNASHFSESERAKTHFIVRPHRRNDYFRNNIRGS